MDEPLRLVAVVGVLLFGGSARADTSTKQPAPVPPAQPATAPEEPPAPDPSTTSTPPPPDPGVTPTSETAPAPTPTPTPAPALTPTLTPTPTLALTEPSEPSDESRSVLGLPPLGSFLYATSTAEIGLLLGSFPTAGGFGTGFHYAERGGLFAKWLMAGLAGGANATAAQARANETGRTQSYEAYSPDDFGSIGLTINAMTPQLGGNVRGTQADLFFTNKLRKRSSLPVLIDFGFAFYYFKGPVTQTMDAMGNSVTVEHEVLGAGAVLGVLLPVTRWAQLELHARPVFGDLWLTFEAAAVINVGNRFYARVMANFSKDGDAAPMIGVGGRL